MGQAASRLRQVLPNGTMVALWAERGDDSAARVRAALHITVGIGGAVLVLACFVSFALTAQRARAVGGAAGREEKERLHDEYGEYDDDDEEEEEQTAPRKEPGRTRFPAPTID